jgi:hypothetical protein
VAARAQGAHPAGEVALAEGRTRAASFSATLLRIRMLDRSTTAVSGIPGAICSPASISLVTRRPAKGARISACSRWTRAMARPASAASLPLRAWSSASSAPSNSTSLMRSRSLRLRTRPSSRSAWRCIAWAARS